MSEMTSVVETQQHQQYVGDNSNVRHHCKDCGVNFDSEASLKVHLHYHEKNLLNQWANKAQQEESNNNHSKTGNHNSHVNVNRDSVTVPADSSEPSSMSPSQDPTSSQQQQQPQQQQSQQQPQQQQQSAIQLLPYDHFQTPMYNESGRYYNEQPYMLTPFSPSQEDGQSNRDGNGGYSRYHPYQLQQHYSADRTTSNSTSPQSPPLQCDKCGAVYEDTNQLGEHMRTTHLESPSAYPPALQYGPQLGNSPQQLHPSPPLSNQPQQQPYDYNGGQTNKSDIKQEPEEQAEILDLDSHKVQTHRFEEEYLRGSIHQQQHQQQGLQMQMQHRVQIPQHQQQQHRSHSVSSMLANWLPTQSHDYHPGLGPMGPVDNVPPSIPDQGQFMRNQHIPVEHGHQSSPIITSTQPMTGHQMPAGFAQQTPKAPLTNQSWKSNEPRRPKTYNCTACNKWFTSSGHLKRHYNTTLHKNAVKNGKEPDPATQPISSHHHPTRDNNNHSASRSGGAPARSPPNLPSSRSPPNLMAGPSGEATGGLLHTPITHCNSNSSNSSSDSSATILAQQQLVHLPHSGIMPINSPVPSSLAGHPQQQMGSAPHQLGLQQQQQQQLHLPTDSPGQPVHHTTSSPMPPQAASHMNCPSPMDTSPQQHHMNSLLGSIHPAMTSPTAMGGTTMSHQPYPNALPPHVTPIISQDLLESTPLPTMQLITSGNKQQLPGFMTFEHKTMPSFQPIQVLGLDENQFQIINVGGLSMEEITPQESFESSPMSYDPYSPSRYKSLINVQVVTNEEQVSAFSYQVEGVNFETNNNYLPTLNQAQEENINPNIKPNIGLQPKKGRKRKAKENKPPQVTTTATNNNSQEHIHRCLECHKSFERSCYLTQHNKSSHSGEKPFKCAKCGKKFAEQKGLDTHIIKHDMKEKKHRCTYDYCTKAFAHRTDLKRHLCTHSKERPFQCDECGKGFIRQDHMKKHKATHSKKKIRSAQRANTRGNNSRMNLQPVNVQQFNGVGNNYEINCKNVCQAELELSNHCTSSISS